MSAKAEAMNGEVIEPRRFEPADFSFVLCCDDCGRAVLSEHVFVTEAGDIICAGCKEVSDLIES